MTDLPSGFLTVEVPARIADLGFSFARPTDWVLADLPAEDTDFSVPTAFAALAVAMAPYAALVFSAAARPAYADGTLADWLGWLARQEGYDPGPIEHESFVSHPAVACWAMQQGDGVLLRMRLVLFEDGGRLVMLSAMAPLALWTSAHDTLRTMLASFVLAAPRGSSRSLAPTGVTLAESSYVVGASTGDVGVSTKEPAPVAASDSTGSTGNAAVLDGPHGSVVDHGGDDLPVQSFDSGAPATYAEVARAADVSTLLPEHELNQRLLHGGAGFPAAIVQDHGALCAAVTVKAVALHATITVPYGWHVLDDTQRTLVHDGSGGVQIAMLRRPREGRYEHDFLLDFWREVRADAPGVEAQRVRFRDTEALVMQDLPIEGVLLAQTVLVRRAPSSQFLVVRITSAFEEHERAMNTGELLIRHAQFLDEPLDGPDWWGDALRLATLGDFDAAHRCIRQAVDHLGAYQQIAHLHELHGRRLAALGDAEGCQRAYEESAEWMGTMATMATSGGEGAALSLARDEHRIRLGLPPV